MDRSTLTAPLMSLGLTLALLAAFPAALRGQPEAEPPHAETVPATPFDAPEGAWTLVVLSDTQNLVQSFPDGFRRQMDWIVAHADTHNIRFVLHEGDITNRNTPEQWKVARDGFQRLIDADIPFAVVPGNHDYGEMGQAQDRSTPLNDYFQPSDYANSGRVGYFEEGRLENTWHEFAAPTGDYVVLALEFGPRDEVLAWANGVIAQRPDRQAIILTHSYLYHDNTRYDWDRYGKSQSAHLRHYGLAQAGNANDGQAMWEKLVSRHARIRFVLSGHVLGDGNGHLASTGEHGNTVHQILANYQNSVTPKRPFAGAAYLRLMQFEPEGQTVRIRTYSPWLDDWMTGPDQQFECAVAGAAAVETE